MLVLITILFSAQCATLEPIDTTATFRFLQQYGYCKILTQTRPNVDIGDCAEMCFRSMHSCNAFMVDANITCRIYTYQPIDHSCDILPVNVWERL